MKLRLIIAAASIVLAQPAFAGGLTEIGLDDPVVASPTTPQFSWSGVYAGVSYGQSSHRRTYDHRQETPWEKHVYACNRGDGHFGSKCDVTGLTHAPEFGPLNRVNRPWDNAADQTVLYENGYEGLWMGADETFAFTLGSYVAPVVRNTKWAHISYDHVTGVDVRGWSETVTERDTTLGGFVGYRHQFGSAPLVLGAEINAMVSDSHGSFQQFGVQAGFAMDRVLPYIEIGADHYAGGVDIAFGNRGKLVLGVRSWESHDGDDSGNQLRLAIRF